MTQHSSLKSSAGRRGQRRSVLKRMERLKILKQKQKRKNGDPVYGLPKVKPEG
ncbi:small basic protein [candidate division NPL-UPA2 bacterium]|nr:small basic protein [candidate division NPL-UPA2 bacterium]